MGTYNPSAPQNLGEEWVPIRDEDLVFSPAVNAFELGHGFTLATPRTLQDARFYIKDYPAGLALGQTFQAAVYPRGYEDRSGPIQRVVIPCNSGAATGGSGPSGGAVTFADGVADPSDGKYVGSQGGGAGTSKIGAFFAVNQYASTLTNKRIISVNLLYSASVVFTVQDLLDDGSDMYMGVLNDAGQGFVYGFLSSGTFPMGDNSPFQPRDVYRVPMGEIDQFWSTSLSPYGTPDRMPWTYANLQKFEASAANRHPIIGATSGSSPTAWQVQWHYLALEVLYCEEQRVAVGGAAFGSTTGTLVSTYKPYVFNANALTLRTIAQVANPVLAAGDYTLVLSSADVGTLIAGVQPVSATKYPIVEALRELYSIPPHPGVQVNLPFPATEAIVGRTFTQETTHVLPHLSLHTSGGPLTEVHVYGRQAAAPVYGSVTATQGIINSAVGTTTYPQVRFWARRFGDTTVSLTVRAQATPTTTVSITVAAFDALDEILDGWKEVTLAFTAPNQPSFTGAGTATTYEWLATGENIGNRWEILGAIAPAISGIPGNLLNLVPSPNQLGTATYGGTTAFLSWQSPNVTGTTADTTADAAVIFAMDMPTVTGWGVTETNQTVTGIGLNCGLPPGCIPTGIGYHRLAWTSYSALYGASSAPVSGFGYYELQRMDTIDTTWQTIMQASSPAASGFSDYEARVGILSSYRIRACDHYQFCGPWSATITSTLSSPGVAGVGDGNGVLIFTSNYRQAGIVNLAYTQQWESDVSEQFEFREAGAVKLQDMYNRDYVTAFRPLERGGEKFAATLLVQAASVAAPVLEGVFTSLRDMAWDTVPYICVRNELGDRWLATVLVPEGVVRRNRRLQLARVQVIEVTDTPYPVDPNS